MTPHLKSAVPRRTALCCLLLVAGSVQIGLAADKPKVDFAREIRPILSDKCFQCHGPDENARQAELRLDRAAAAAEVLSAGQPEKSELLRRIRSRDADERMPPPASKLSLTPAEIKTLERWIQQGAGYAEHWAFAPLTRTSPPPVRNTAWARTPIDRFLLADLEQAGVSPSADAPREQLIRRLCFDLTGLPPTLAEIDAFLADKSPRAYELLVDRLLKKPAYGENMAAWWLDAARYSDSYGYQVDRDRHVWPWRDWVIQAFNRNLPYDQFIRQQLAGDLLPKANEQTILATTFNRLHPQKVEGGSVPEEFRVEYVADRNHTWATAFLGLTLECCRCHDHKFDPVSQREYYQLFAFFNNIDEAGLYSYFTSSVPTPTLRLSTAAQKKRLAELRAKTADAEARLVLTGVKQRDAFERWLAERPPQPDGAAPPIPGRIETRSFEDHKGGANASVPGVRGKAIQLSGDDAYGLSTGNFRRFQPFSISLWINTPDHKKRAVIFHRSRAWTDAASRGYQLLLEDGQLSASLIHFWPGNALRVRTRAAIPHKRWLHVGLTYDGSSRARGLQLFVNGQEADVEVVRDNLYKNITGGGGDKIAIGARFRDRGFTRGKVDEFQVFSRQLAPLEIAQLHDGKSLTEALARPPAALTPQQREDLLAYYLQAYDLECRQRLAELQASRAELCKLQDSLQEIMVMQEMAEPRATRLLQRGAYNAPGAPVEPGTPAVFPPFPPDAPRNRLGLARWLTDPEHPLTARVAVNRAWQLCFGMGLVATPEDFGSQGKPPTNPALLDWLARDFITSGWDFKRLLKQIVMSSAYRQSSAPTAEQQKRDPNNRLLSRAPRYRLSAEKIRDNALAISGLLVKKVGGPPARPYEVAVSFKPVRADSGAGLYRRSVYTYWKRTAPAPVMMSLDANKRDVCRVKRERTSSPLQAFVLLNSPQFVEAARVTAERLLKQHGENHDAAVTDVFRLLTSRRPTPAERKILGKLHQQQLAYFGKDRKRAEYYLATGHRKRDTSLPAVDVASLAMVVGALLNYDECVMKR